jgi:hypothetical protein
LLRCGQSFLRNALTISGENRMSRVRCDSSRSVSASREGVMDTLAASSSGAGLGLLARDFKIYSSSRRSACRTARIKHVNC